MWLALIINSVLLALWIRELENKIKRIEDSMELENSYNIRMHDRLFEHVEELRIKTGIMEDPKIRKRFIKNNSIVPNDDILGWWVFEKEEAKDDGN